MTTSEESPPIGQSDSDISDPSTYKPDTPKYGGLTQSGPDYWVPWTGGKPKEDWSGLEKPDPVTTNPNQYRVTSITSSAKSRVYRIKGLEHKLSRTGDLQLFQRKIMDHLVEFGLDTVTYMVDPTEGNRVVSVIDHHSRFEVKEGVKQANAMNNWDK